jgi:hypothetical protein
MSGFFFAHQLLIMGTLLIKSIEFLIFFVYAQFSK